MSLRRRKALGRSALALAALVLAILVGTGVTSTPALAAGGTSSSKTYTATTDNGITVSVEAPEGAFSEDVTLQASVRDENGTDAAAAELDHANVAYDGIVALDVRFVNAAGDEVEPAQAVDVRFELPSDVVPADAESLAVHHLAEDESGAVTDVETVADAADASEGTVDVQSDTAVAEFKVESFSSFAITWSNYFNVTVHYVDENGEEISGGLTNNLTISNTQSRTFKDYDIDISGYTFVEARYEKKNGPAVTNVAASQSGSGRNTQRKLTFSNGSNEVGSVTYSRGDSTITQNVYLVYKVVSGVQIKDTILTDGLFSAKLTGGLTVPEGGSVEYSWERSVDGESWSSVERQLVTGSNYNLASDGTSVNVAYDSVVAKIGSDQRCWYRVTATVKDVDGNEAEYTSSALQVPFYTQLQNGSFETPQNSSLMNQIENGSQGVIWQTTGLGTGTHQGQDIEIVRPSKTNGAQSNYHIEEADDGAQFAELNCEAYGALYQDVLTVPGATLNWYLSHAGRWGTDKMALVIAPVDDAKDITTKLEAASQDPDEIQRILNEYDNQNGYVEYFEDVERNWTRYNGTYTVPEGQYATRFFFVAVSTSSGDSSVGNLIDYVGFGSTPRPPERDEGLLTVRKVVEGFQPDAEGTPDYSVTVHVAGEGIDEDVALTTFTKEGESWVVTGSVTIENMDPGTTCDVSVSENVTNAPEDYTETSRAESSDSSVQAGDDGKSISGVTVTAGDETGTTVTFTNSYEANARYGLFVYKGEALDKDDTVVANPDKPLSGATFSVKDENGETVGSGTTENGYLAIDKLKAGTYTISEDQVPAGYQLLGEEITLTINEDGKATFTMNGAIENAKTVSEANPDVAETNPGCESYFYLSVANEPNEPIPSTGGLGNLPLYAVGVAAIAGSVLAARRVRSR